MHKILRASIMLCAILGIIGFTRYLLLFLCIKFAMVISRENREKIIYLKGKRLKNPRNLARNRVK